MELKPLVPASPLPCRHEWLWVDNDEDCSYAYFQCQHCYVQVEYAPEELADLEYEAEADYD